MENSNKCALCGKIDVLQSYDFSKQIQISFFSVNKKHFPEDFVKDINLCVICAQKIQLSTCIKKDYDEMCNRNNRITNLKCFFCEQKTYLTNLDDNPNETRRKIDVFLNAVIIRHEWKQFKACLKCLYNLDVWFEVRNNLFTVKNIPTTIAENELTHNNNNRSLSQHRSPRKVLTKLNLEKHTITNTKRNKPRPRRKQNNKKEVHWNKYLNERLSKFQTVNKLMDNSNLCVIITEVNIKDEDKLFDKLPFVEIFLNSQTNTRKEDIIVISDTETEPVGTKRSTRKRKLNLSLTSLLSLKSNEGSPIQTSVKSSSRTSKRKQPPKKDYNDINSIESSTESSTEVIDSSSDEQENFVCNVCDKCFTVRCEYLQHRLSHEKIQKLVVKVLRHNLPQKLDVSKLENKESPSSSSVNINALLSKWVGESAAEEYQEYSKNCDSNIEDDTKIDKDSEENKEEDEVQMDVSADKLKENTEEKQSNEEAEPIVNETENNVDDTEEISDEDKEDDVSEVPAKECENKNDTVTESCKDVQDKSEEAAIALDQEKNDDEEKEEEENNDEEREEENNDEEKEEEEEEENGDEEKKKEEIEKDDDKNKKEEQAAPDEELNEQEDEEKESDKDNDEEESSRKRDEESEKSLKEKEDNDENEITETIIDLDKIENKDTIVSSESKKTKSSVEAEEFSNGSSDPDPVMSCDDLLNILDDDDTKLSDDSKKRKHESIEEEETPKRKRVRFAEEKEIYTPDKVVTLEKIIENDQFSQEETETDKNGDSET